MMVSVPDQLAEDHPHVITPDATVIRYRARGPLLSAHVLVQRTTFVHVRSGTKHLMPHDAVDPVLAEQGAVLAMRTGSHVMSEFHGGDEPYQSTVFSLDRGFLRRAIGAPTEVPPGPRVAVARPDPRVLALFEGIIEGLAPDLPAADREYRLRELVVALMASEPLRRLMYAEAVDWGATVHERVSHVVGTHALEPLTVPDLAGLCAMSVSTFKRHFQQIYGVPPGRWLQRKRLERASTLLLHGDHPVSEIGESIGYRNTSTFIRAFRREFGTTPLQHRLSGRPTGLSTLRAPGSESRRSS